MMLTSLKSILDPTSMPARIARESNWRPDAPDQYCHRCGATMNAMGVTDAGCALCVNRRLPWRRVVRLSKYDKPMSSWIVAMKFARHWSWATWMGRELARQLSDQPSGERSVVCPVPMHWARQWRRGFNQADLMARAFAGETRLPMIHLLRRTRHTVPQTQVSHSMRPTNVRGSMAIERINLTGWHVWLIDDVTTTGATLTAAARMLRQAGAESISVAVAAVA